MIRTEADRAISGDQKFIWGNNMEEFFKYETKLDENWQKAYTLIFVKCTEHMRSKLEAHKYCQTMRGNYGVLLLIAAIKGLTYKFYRHKHQSHDLHNSKQELYHYYQKGNTTNPQYLDTFKNKVSAI